MDDKPNSQNSVAAIVDAAVGGLSGIPMPIQRGLYKAFERLCLSAVELPAAYLESYAEERKALTAARVKIAGSVAGQMAEKGVVDEQMSQFAVDVWTKKILGKQKNINEVVRGAVNHARNSASDLVGSLPGTGLQGADAVAAEPSGETQVGDDWLNLFEGEAENATSEGLRDAFARILAGEVKRPGAFSVRTVRTVALIPQDTAMLFQRLCSLAVRARDTNGGIYDMRIWSLGLDAGSNELKEFGITYAGLTALMEAGLIHTDLMSSRAYLPALQNSSGDLMNAVEYAGCQWSIEYANAGDEQSQDERKRFTGIAFTRTGAELSEIVDVDEHAGYTAAMHAFLQQSGLRIRKVLALKVDGRYYYEDEEQPAGSP